jgi:hypothetical protein
MVAHTHRFGANATWCSYRFRWRYRSCTVCLHTILMQQVYRNILVIIVGFSALHLLSKERTIVFLIIALSVLLLSAISERAAVAINTGWLWFGEKAGRVNAAILLFLVYYLILTPLAFLSRIGNKDPLKLKAPQTSNFVFKKHKYSADDLRNPW